MQPQDAIPIITTKLHIPPTQANLVLRPRLMEQLEAGQTRKLTLLSAPAGFGKTTLVSASHAQQQPAGRVAWLSLDEGDNDAVRFLTYLVSALQQIEPDLGQPALRMLQAEQLPGWLPQIESLMALLLNDLAAVTTGFSLVLDDYHVIENEDIHNALTFLLDHLPPQAHLILISRVDPPLPLARFRAHSQLHELRVDDLRFTVEEAADFLNTVMALDLQSDDIALLEDRTEGWIAGLQLAALSMQGTENPAAFIASFSGQDRYIVDYLLEEVFQRQSAANQAFLLQTSILDHLCGPLCDAVCSVGYAVTEQEAGQTTLEAFEKANLFILPLDNERRWYRYQHLFVEFLRGRLQNTNPDLIPELHLRAAHWCLAQGATDKAIDHTLAAGDFEAAAELIEQNADSVLRVRGELTTYLRWLEALSTDVLLSRPRLSLDRAWALSFSGHWKRLEVELQEIDGMLNAEGSSQVIGVHDLKTLRAEALAIRAELALYQDSPDTALTLAKQALADLPADSLRWRASLTQIQGYIYRLNGETESAITVLRESSDLSQQGGHLAFGAFALSDLAEVYAMQGQFNLAVDTFRQAIALPAEQDVWPFPPTCAAYVGLGSVLYEQNALDSAAQYLEKGIDLGQQGGYDGFVRRGNLMLARLKQAQGHSDDALAALQAAEVLTRTSQTPWVKMQYAAMQAWLWLMQGQLNAAGVWADAYANTVAGIPMPVYQAHGEQVLIAEIHLAQRRLDSVGLERLCEVAKTRGWHSSRIHILVLQAITHELQGATPVALVALEEALNLAESAGCIRPFLDKGAIMIKLLRLALSQRVSPSFVGRLQASFMPSVEGQTVKSQPLIEPLTKRELEVLQYIATGMSNREIAEAMIVAMGTVAKYTNNIFTKLNVRNRMQAVTQAKALELI